MSRLAAHLSALPIIKDLMDYGTVQGRSMLGVSGIMLDAFTAEHYDLVEGFYIYELENPNAGTLRAGDIIYKVNDTLIQSFDDLSELIDSSQVGDTLRVLANREGKKVICDVVLGDGGK